MTPNKEDYLKCLYELNRSEQKVTNKQIAHTMNVSAPAVTEMMKKLLAEQLIEKTKDAGYQLNQNGMLLVSDLVRKHRLLEVFLMKNLNYTVEEVHSEAEILEHTVSELFIERLDQLLHYPTVCPHGGTIPKKRELLREEFVQPLASATPGQHLIVRRVIDHIDLLRYLDNHHIHVGTTLYLSNVDDYTHTYTVELSDDSIPVQLPEKVAHQLFIEPISS